MKAHTFKRTQMSQRMMDSGLDVHGVWNNALLEGLVQVTCILCFSPKVLQQMMAQVLGFLALTWENHIEVLAPGTGLAQT